MNFDPTERMVSHIRALKTYEGVDPTEVLARQAGIAPDQVIKLNGNENPFGPSPRVADALASYPYYNQYPDPDQRHLRTVLSDYLNVAPEQVVAGNGSDELIDMVLRIFLEPGQKVIDPTPTFGMYRFSTAVCGGQAVAVPRNELFDVDVDEIEQVLDDDTKLTFLASPNNPTANVAQEWQVRRLLDKGLIVVVDETYHEFCGYTLIPLLQEYPNLIVLRTFSKWAGLAGLRIGLGIMDPRLARVMMGMKSPYNVNVAAEAALTASLEDRDELLRRVECIVQERDRLFSKLEALPGVTPWPTQANFILTQLPQGRGKELFEGLARKGIFVRYFGGDRLEDFVRISVGLPHQTDAVISALESLLEK